MCTKLVRLTDIVKVIKSYCEKCWSKFWLKTPLDEVRTLENIISSASLSRASLKGLNARILFEVFFLICDSTSTWFRALFDRNTSKLGAIGLFGVDFWILKALKAYLVEHSAEHRS